MEGRRVRILSVIFVVFLILMAQKARSQNNATNEKEPAPQKTSAGPKNAAKTLSPAASAWVESGAAPELTGLCCLAALPPPWSVEEGETYFVVKDNDGQELAYLHFDDPRSAAKALTRDEARRIAA